MKTILKTTLLAGITLAAIGTPHATSDTGELNRILELETQVAQLNDDIATLSKQAACMTSGMAVTRYTQPDGTTYLAPTRSTKHRRVWMVVMTPGCMPIHPTPRELAWHW